MGFSKDLLASTHQCETGNDLGVRFFSDQNLNVVQARLRTVFYQKTGYVIGSQSPEDVALIMRATYLEHARHGMPSIKELERLNDIVISILVPMVATNVSQYLGYLRDASRIAEPLGRPTNESIKGRNTLQYNRY